MLLLNSSLMWYLYQFFIRRCKAQSSIIHLFPFYHLQSPHFSGSLLQCQRQITPNPVQLLSTHTFRPYPGWTLVKAVKHLQNQNSSYSKESYESVHFYLFRNYLVEEIKRLRGSKKHRRSIQETFLSLKHHRKNWQLKGNTFLSGVTREIKTRLQKMKQYVFSNHK